MRQRQSIAPAIERVYSEADKEIEVIETIHSSVTHERGFGDVGQKYQLVDVSSVDVSDSPRSDEIRGSELVRHGCPACGHERMIREVDVSAELSDGVGYWCLNPLCKHFVADQLEAKMNRIRASEPTVRELGGGSE